MINITKSIEQLENDTWEKVDFPTGLVEKCFQFRKIPLQDLSIEQMRLLISQNIGLQFLIPTAVEILQKNILAEGDLYEGDLLAAVLTIDNDFLNKNPQLKLQIDRLIITGRKEIEKSNEDNIHRQLLKKIDAFNLQ